MIPQYSLDGVQQAEISTHYYSTEDGLGESLLRFTREECDDVVLLIPGLTNSSDLFIMPEHNNLVSTLLDNGYTDVWTLDCRMSNRLPYNLLKRHYTIDDVALYDHPAAIAKIRQHIGNKRLHVIAHCVGSISFMMSLFAGKVDNITSVITNSVSLTPQVSAWAYLKLSLGPAIIEYLFDRPYANPNWKATPGWGIGKLLSNMIALYHRECNNPACNMLSFMWGSGHPAVYQHENLLPQTHERVKDLFGGTGLHYYRHIRKMAKHKRAVKYKASEPRHQTLPNDYLSNAANIDTPIFFVTGDANHVFPKANILAYETLERLRPSKNSLKVFPNYGHMDVFMGKDCDKEVFPDFLTFLRQHSG